jgi:arginase
MARSLAVIGVPSSAGAFAPGQEKAPRALRDAGLVELLREAGVEVRDRGDRQVWRWRPDRDNRRAQNVQAVTEIVRETAQRVAEAADAGEATLVLGGDCTVGIGAVAGHTATGARVGLVYFDSHADLNTPASVHEGTLDWMGLAHMLGEDGAVPDLVNAGPRTPLLEDEQLVLLGWGPEQATPFERSVLARRAIRVVPVDEIAADPAGSARRARELVEASCDRLLVHFDVDVVDFTDVPLSENWGRNEGLAYADAILALETLAESPQLAGITITELNPEHTEEGARSIERFAADVSRALAASPALSRE